MTGLEDVLDALRDSLDDLVRETCERIYSQLDSYAQIEPDLLASAVERNLRTALTALRENKIPDPPSLDGAAQTARERYSSGVPVEEIIRGFRISISLIHERYVDLSISLGLPVETTVNGSRIMWGVGDAFTTRIITEYHAIELDTALRDAQVRAAAVRSLLAGEIPADASLASLDPHALYAAVRCDVPQEGDVDRVRRLLETTGSRRGVRALVVADGGTCLGVVAGRPDDPGLPVGLGTFVSADELPRSDRVARQALRLAQALGRTGVQSVDELGWRLAAVNRTDVWRLYHDYFRGPLDAEGAFGEEILDAVRAWLVAGQSISKAAEALTVHVNTVRYRLRRYEELTGADLSSPDDLVAVWWVLELGRPGSLAL